MTTSTMVLCEFWWCTVDNLPNIVQHYKKQKLPMWAVLKLGPFEYRMRLANYLPRIQLALPGNVITALAQYDRDFKPDPSIGAYMMSFLWTGRLWEIELHLENGTPCCSGDGGGCYNSRSQSLLLEYEPDVLTVEKKAPTSNGMIESPGRTDDGD